MTDSTHRIVFEPIAPDVEVPRRATEGAAGYDVRAYLLGRHVRVRLGSNGELCQRAAESGRLALEPGDVALVPTGFKARIPLGLEAQVRIRSSMAFKRGLILPNAPGTIDADYPDEWLIMIKNDSSQLVAIEHGERIAQVVLGRFITAPWVKGVVDLTTDRSGGFGSTGNA